MLTKVPVVDVAMLNNRVGLLRAQVNAYELSRKHGTACVTRNEAHVNVFQSEFLWWVLYVSTRKQSDFLMPLVMSAVLPFFV